jgi:hypothetical protein
MYIYIYIYIGIPQDSPFVATNGVMRLLGTSGTNHATLGTYILNYIHMYGYMYIFIHI